MSGFNPNNSPGAVSEHGQNVECLVMTEQLISDFLQSQEERGLTDYTMFCYRNRITRLYKDLPEDKSIGPTTLSEWRNLLLERGITRTRIMGAMVTANKFVEFCHREDLASNLIKESADALTRQDYFHLLDVARTHGKDRTYLLVRAFGAMGLEVSELSQLTVEAARKGEIIRKSKPVHIPESFQEELLGYAAEQGITEGEILLSRRGTSLHRSNVSCEMKVLCSAAGFPESDRYPRQLRLLYANTKEEIAEALNPLVEQITEMVLTPKSFEEG